MNAGALGRRSNRIPDDVRGQIIDLALEETQLSPRELAVRFTDTRGESDPISLDTELA